MSKRSIAAIQDEFVTTFHALEADPHMALDYLIELGERLPLFPEEEKVAAHLIPGCLSRVWLTHRIVDGILYLQGDSDAATTKGLLSLFIHIFSGQPIEAVRAADFSFLEKMHLPRLLGAQRRSGLGHMVARIRAMVTPSHSF